jgi:hypothetical protein
MVKPFKVTVATALAATVPDCNVITMVEAAVAPALPPAPPLNNTLEAVTPAAKKPEGYARVMLFPAESAPPAVVLKLKVTDTFDLFTTRSESATWKYENRSPPPRSPDARAGDSNRSRLVDTVTLPPGVGADPMVNPSRVMVAAALAATVPVDNVITILETPVALALAAAPLSETLGGVPPAAKKPEGYISVIVLLAESAPPAVGINENVAITFPLLTTRSLCAMRKDVKFDEPPITPDATDTDAVWSTLVCSVTLPPAVGALPIVMPVSVTVTAALATRDPEEAVMTI